MRLLRSAAPSCLTLWDHTDCSPPGSSVHGVLRARILDWGASPGDPPGDLPHPGIELSSLMSPALAARFFTTGATWEPECMRDTPAPVWGDAGYTQTTQQTGSISGEIHLEVDVECFFFSPVSRGRNKLYLTTVFVFHSWGAAFS